MLFAPRPQISLSFFKANSFVHLAHADVKHLKKTKIGFVRSDFEALNMLHNDRQTKNRFNTDTERFGKIIFGLHVVCLRLQKICQHT